jgi:hypothetical protein
MKMDDLGYAEENEGYPSRKAEKEFSGNSHTRAHLNKRQGSHYHEEQNSWAKSSLTRKLLVGQLQHVGRL